MYPLLSKRSINVKIEEDTSLDIPAVNLPLTVGFTDVRKNNYTFPGCHGLSEQSELARVSCTGKPSA